MTSRLPAALATLSGRTRAVDSQDHRAERLLPSRHGDPCELLAASCLLAEPALEAGYPPAGVEDLLLAGVEGVAVRADIGVDDAVARGGPRREGVPARAGHRRFHVVRVNAWLHFITPASSVAGSPRRLPPGVNRYRALSASSVCQTPERVPGPGDSRANQVLTVVFCTCSRNSALLLVPFIRSMSTSSACCGSSACSTRRSCQTIFSSSGPSSSSSLRVPEASTSMAGKIRFSASSRRSRSSMLPVPLNSSKITSSAREPVSISAVARIVTEPPCSMLRAAPKNRLGG